MTKKEFKAIQKQSDENFKSAGLKADLTKIVINDLNSLIAYEKKIDEIKGLRTERKSIGFHFHTYVYQGDAHIGYLNVTGPFIELAIHEPDESRPIAKSIKKHLETGLIPFIKGFHRCGKSAEGKICMEGTSDDGTQNSWFNLAPIVHELERIQQINSDLKLDEKLWESQNRVLTDKEKKQAKEAKAAEIRKLIDNTNIY